MDKIAIATVRYGKEINGGAEYHARMIAERLSEKYEVEIITTCVGSIASGENAFKAGAEIINGITVRRFPVSPLKDCTERHARHKAKPAWIIRKLLYDIGLLKYFSGDGRKGVWKYKMEADRNAQWHNVFWSDEMASFLQKHKDDYKAVLAFTAIFPPFYIAAMTAGEKMIAIPTLHLELASFRPTLTEAFRKIRYVGFNTDTEQKLASDIIGKSLGRNGIISTGIETIEPASWEEVKAKFALPEKYVLYIGRIEPGKTGKLLKYWKSYMRKFGDSIRLVMVGGISGKVEKPEGTTFTGFVTDEERRAILQHAYFFINPSKFESLSLVLLEAFNDRIPVMVNGKCNVLKDHCIKSGNGALYYTSRRSFVKRLHEGLHNKALRAELIEKGYKYYCDNYDWKIIMSRLQKAIDEMP